MSFTDFEATTWATTDEITAVLMNELEKRAMGARPTVKVYRSNVLSSQTSVATIEFEAEAWDNDSMWDVLNPTTPVTVQQAGVYLINATVALSGSSSTNNTYMSLELNNDTGAFGDGTVLGFSTGTQIDSTPTLFYHQVSAVGNLSGSDEVKLLVDADTTWGLTANNYDVGDGCWLSMTMVARTPTLS